MSVHSEIEKVADPRRVASSGLASWARRNGLQLGIVAVLLVIWGIFIIFAPTTFLSHEIYQAFMSSTPFFAMMALPLTLIVIAAEMDLSFPSVMALSMTAFAITYNLTINMWLALLACLVTGIIAGLVNGLIVVKIGIPALVATIGTQFFYRGLVLVINGGNGFSLVPIKDTALYNLLVGRQLGIPAQMVWTILIAIAVWIFLNRTRPGAHLYLVGDNIDSSRLMGINVDQRKIMAFALVGLAAAFAGLVASLEINYFWPTLGEGYLLQTLASVFLGGTSVFGGTGTVFGTFIAAFIIGAINAGIVAVGLGGFWTQVIYGFIIIVSVSLQTVLGRRLRK
ncbi:MAG: ABC transporter permease [Chloroflexi bacterium]|nr:ABC transporter permease [Chloroflexota bacterium]